MRSFRHTYSVDLLPCEAEFLKLDGKVEVVLTTQQKEKANA